MSRFFRLAAGLALIPLCVATTLALLDVMRGIAGGSGELFFFASALAGAGYAPGWPCGLFLPQPVRAYVMAHELTHALWGLVIWSTDSQDAGRSAGSNVSLSKTNLLITLAPYFFPFYTVLVLLLRWVVERFVQPVPLPNVWVFLVGLTWGFHLCFTVQSLLTRQPDILEYGRVLSYAVIYLFNLLGICLWLVCTTSVSVSAVIAALLLHTTATYAAVGNLLARAVADIVGRVT